MIKASRELSSHSGHGKRSLSLCQQCHIRRLSNTSTRASGHNKWSSIKRDKARNDSLRAKQGTILAKHITNASKHHGPDPKMNAQLAGAIANAKRAGMPKSSIESAITRGQGRSDTGAALEALTIEAMVPPTALIVECETDSKGRALLDLRNLLKRNGATTTPTAYLFERRGRISFAAKDGLGVDEVLEAALESGALDVDSTGQGQVIVDTRPQDLKEVEANLTKTMDLEAIALDTIWLPKLETAVTELDCEPLAELNSLRESLEEYPGVQGVYTNLIR